MDRNIKYYDLIIAHSTQWKFVIEFNSVKIEMWGKNPY